nr:MAG TPA: YopX protein [Caudoviricetes sp.]
MREILFRGKSIEDNKWVYGDLIREKKSFGKICTRIYRTTNNGWELIDVDSKAVGQYTGLNDKNGTKIFEGDICSFCNTDGGLTNYEVLWFGRKWVVREASSNVVDNLDLSFCEYSVAIGNIYDNPELLEE